MNINFKPFIHGRLACVTFKLHKIILEASYIYSMTAFYIK